MHALFLMFAFPDLNKSFNMYTTIVEEFVRQGHNVVVLAPGQETTRISVEKGISILRVKTLPIKNVPNYLKGISNMLLPFQYERVLKKFYPGLKFDLIVAPTPPITLVNLAVKLKRKCNAKFYLMLRDIFPQNAVDLGFMKKDGFFHRYFRKKETKLYKEANYIGCMSQGNIDYVLRENPELTPNKFHILRNFQKPYQNHAADHSGLRKKYQMEDKFVIVFGGNMGKPQQLENVLQLASSCLIHKDILFLILGEGVQMQRIARISEERSLTNIRIHNTIPKEEYQDLLSVCQLGLISLHQDFTIPNIPSKALDYFNVGVPVLASLDRHTDFGQILDENELGLWSYAGEHQKFMENLEKLYTNSSIRTEMSKNVKRYFNRYLEPETAYHTIINVINEHKTNGDRPY